jgi:molybdopterin/thiamine biosynthesis adenylyltransferase
MASTSIEQQARDPTIRYDRQVRLWGVNAQAKLEQTNVCLLGASGAGTEALKNLVLPGLL